MQLTEGNRIARDELRFVVSRSYEAIALYDRELDQPKGDMNEYEYSRIYRRPVAAGSAWTLSQPADSWAIGRRHPRDSEVRKLRRSSRLLRDTRRKAARRLRCLRSGPL
jgi:hypothetical protein